MVLGKIPVPGRPANLNNNWARAFSACSRCKGGGERYLDIFYSFIISLFFQLMGGGPI